MATRTAAIHRVGRRERRERAEDREALTQAKKDPYWSDGYPRQWIQVDGVWVRNPEWVAPASDWLPPGCRDSTAWLYDEDGVDRRTYRTDAELLPTWIMYANECDREGAIR